MNNMLPMTGRLTSIFCFGLASVSTLLMSDCLADHPFSGGETTVVIPKAQSDDRSAFSRPASNLTLTRRGDFFAGNSFFQNAWVTAPASTKSRDGLGPIFNTMSCQTCHIKDGRGRAPKGDEEMMSLLLRLSVDPSNSNDDQHKTWLKQSGVIPDRIYGDQIQNRAITNVKPEAKVNITWEEIDGRYPDGKRYRLRKPKIKIDELAYGKLSTDVQFSLRVAPALIGIGLLEAISIEDIEQLADPDDENGDGISGRLNRVWDIAKQETVPGRFGWKAEQPSIKQQVAAAFRSDIGITSTLFPDDPLTMSQQEVIKTPHGGQPEVSGEILRLVTFYCKTLAVPARRSHDSPFILEGEQLFKQANCHRCHVDTWTTGFDEAFPELSEQTIHPYTDLLIHDMGEGLADHRPVFSASGREWRTPPLWGAGLVFRVNRHTNFLHDSRARNLEEAILWHGGEALESKKRFMNFSSTQRRKLIAFLKSL